MPQPASTADPPGLDQPIIIHSSGICKDVIRFFINIGHTVDFMLQYFVT